MQPNQNSEPKPAMPARAGKVIQPISSDIMQSAATSHAPAAATSPAEPVSNLSDPTHTNPSSLNAAPVHPTATVSSFTPPPALPEQTITRPTFLHAGDVADKPDPLPRGIYLVVFLAFVGFLTSFFSGPGVIYTISALVNLIIAGGLLLRINGIRVLSIVISSLTCVLLLFAIVGIFVLQQRVDTQTIRYEQAISKVDTPRLTSAEKVQLAKMNAQMDDEKKAVKKAFTVLYQFVLLNGIVQIFIIAYLTRPSVRQAFQHRTI